MHFDRPNLVAGWEGARPSNPFGKSVWARPEGARRWRAAPLYGFSELGCVPCGLALQCALRTLMPCASSTPRVTSSAHAGRRRGVASTLLDASRRLHPIFLCLFRPVSFGAPSNPLSTCFLPDACGCTGPPSLAGVGATAAALPSTHLDPLTSPPPRHAPPRLDMPSRGSVAAGRDGHCCIYRSAAPFALAAHASCAVPRRLAGPPLAACLPQPFETYRRRVSCLLAGPWPRRLPSMVRTGQGAPQAHGMRTQPRARLHFVTLHPCQEANSQANSPSWVICSYFFTSAAGKAVWWSVWSGVCVGGGGACGASRRRCCVTAAERPPWQVSR
ncbi:MAG: hypothetical protein J3K34DRAFT_262569 [Monoraphidium minutum]|nr:MAG: hypothetical protein J3K34DRAFT_262569 [Monoraphidium minutum]